MLALFVAALPALPSTVGDPLHVRRQLLSQSTTYCYLDSSGNLKDGEFISIGCGSREPTAAPACAAGAPSLTSACFLGGNRNGADANRWTEAYAFDHCEQLTVYVHEDGTNKHYCERLARTGDWSTRRRDTAGSGKPESTNDGGWSCWWSSDKQWHDGKCRAKTRFLGEACWDDSGECDNSGAEPYSGLHLSCATMPSLGITSPTCIPSAFAIERNQCECGWFDWYIGFACGAADSACNGHPCVLSTQNGKYFCDYQADNDW